MCDLICRPKDPYVTTPPQHVTSRRNAPNRVDHLKKHQLTHSHKTRRISFKMLIGICGSKLFYLVYGEISTDSARHLLGQEDRRTLPRRAPRLQTPLPQTSNRHPKPLIQQRAILQPRQAKRTSLHRRPQRHRSHH